MCRQLLHASPSLGYAHAECRAAWSPQPFVQPTHPLIPTPARPRRCPGLPHCRSLPQSCINHSCDPNCTAACDSGDRTATLLAQRDIAAGEEITLSYIDVSLPYKRRQAELRDYGFVCKCERCTADLAAARAKKAAGGGKAGGGVGALRAKIGKRR